MKEIIMKALAIVAAAGGVLAGFHDGFHQEYIDGQLCQTYFGIVAVPIEDEPEYTIEYDSAEITVDDDEETWHEKCQQYTSWHDKCQQYR